MNDRDEARLALEGNPVFTDLRMERDVYRDALKTIFAITQDQRSYEEMIVSITRILQEALNG